MYYWNQRKEQVQKEIKAEELRKRVKAFPILTPEYLEQRMEEREQHLKAYKEYYKELQQQYIDRAQQERDRIRKELEEEAYRTHQRVHDDYDLLMSELDSFNKRKGI